MLKKCIKFMVWIFFIAVTTISILPNTPVKWLDSSIYKISTSFCQLDEIHDMQTRFWFVFSRCKIFVCKNTYKSSFKTLDKQRIKKKTLDCFIIALFQTDISKHSDSHSPSTNTLNKCDYHNNTVTLQKH